MRCSGEWRYWDFPNSDKYLRDSGIEAGRVRSQNGQMWPELVLLRDVRYGRLHNSNLS